MNTPTINPACPPVPPCDNPAMLIDPTGEWQDYIAAGEARILALQLELQRLENEFDFCTDPERSQELGAKVIAQHRRIAEFTSQHAAAIQVLAQAHHTMDT